LAAFLGIAVNVSLKLGLYKGFGAPGLAFATAIGAWINGGLLAFLALRKGWMKPDIALMQTALIVATATALLAATTPLLIAPLQNIAARFGSLAPALSLLMIGAAGGVLYAVALFAGFRLSRKS
jgi:putative peptidoglycan lipid II flippase